MQEDDEDSAWSAFAAAELTRIVNVRRQRPRGPQRIRAPAKKTKSSELSFAALWLVPSPRYFANLNGSQDLATCYAGNRCARRLNANHSVFERAEAADTGLIHRDWNGIGLVRHGRISACDTGSREVVTALDASRQHAVDQASRGRRRNARYER